MKMTMKNMKNDSDHLDSLEELSFAIEVGEDIQIVINDIEWYIGFDHDGRRVIAQNPDGSIHYCNSNDDVDEVLDYVIDGKKIRDQWRDIVVVEL